MARAARITRTLSLFTFVAGFAGAAACAVTTAAPTSTPSLAPVPSASATPSAGDLVVSRCAAKTSGSAIADPAPSTDSVDYASMMRVSKATTKDVCELADDNIARATSEIMADIGRTAKVAPRAWDKKTPPAYMHQIDARLALTHAEKAKLAQNGFVVMPRLTSSTYAWALHDLYESELPIYVSMDAILFAIYSSNDKLIAHVEETSLAPKLKDALATLHCALADEHAAFPNDVAKDLDVYLTVARSLLVGAPVASVLGNDEEARALVDSAKKSEGFATLDLFGRSRFVDWSQYKPRGHYAEKARASREDTEPESSGLEGFFRASMWLSRLEFNLSSRSSRSSEPGAVPNTEETPREANVAIALSILAEKSGALNDIDAVTNAWTLFAGKREDVSLDDLVSLRKKAGIERVDEHSADALRLAIGNDFQRTARFHRMPEGSNVLPAIATMLGPRVTPDAAAFMPIVHSHVDGRHMVHAGDVGAMLGLDSARDYLKDDLARFPELPAALDQSKKLVANADDGKSLYDAWFFAVRSIAESQRGIAQDPTAPSFMRTRAFDDLTLDTLVSAYGEIRHNYVLMAGQAYDEGGCVVSDGYVEPRPKTLDYLLSYAARGKETMRVLDPHDSSGAQAYFTNLESTLGVLRHIVQDEIEGRGLSPAEKHFMSMIAEMTPGSSGGPPTYTGWYFDMFRTRQEEALTDASFIADYYTSADLGRVAYFGARSPALGVFVVDTGGVPRAVVGPVARAYEAQSSVAARLTDATIDKAEDVVRPWSSSYEVAAPAPVPLAVVGLLDPDSHEKSPTIVKVASTKNLPHVKIDLLDHNRHVIATMTKSIASKKNVTYTFSNKRTNVSGVRVSVGDFSAEGFGVEMQRNVSITTGGMQLGDDDLVEK